jgi:hypothetical protein
MQEALKQTTGSAVSLFKNYSTNDVTVNIRLLPMRMYMRIYLRKYGAYARKHISVVTINASRNVTLCSTAEGTNALKKPAVSIFRIKIRRKIPSQRWSLSTKLHSGTF